MGYRLLILLGLLVGVFYSLHLLVKDFQALTAARNIFKFLFKRDVSSQNFTMKHSVRWRKILLYDTTQCARYFYCGLGSDSSSSSDNELRRGFTFMLTLDPQEEDQSALEIVKKAYETGAAGEEACRYYYPMCPFSTKTLFEVVKHLMAKQQ